MKTSDRKEAEAGTEEPFLARWSRRKRETAQPAPEEEASPAAEVRQAPLPTDADMPPLETLNEHSDYSGFLSPEVSEELRQLALEKLFHSACFNACDGLDDYAEDYSRFEKLGDLMTADLRFRLEQEAQRALQRERPAAPPEEGGPPNDDSSLARPRAQAGESALSDPDQPPDNPENLS